MTDVELLEKKLAFIETCVRELRQLSQPERIEHDIREERFVAHTLQIAIQAALDIASHIVSERRLGEPRTNRELFALLQQDHWLSPDSQKPCKRWSAFATSSCMATKALTQRSCETSLSIAWMIFSSSRLRSSPA